MAQTAPTDDEQTTAAPDTAKPIEPVKPIIDDEEFNTLIPEFDPALESMEDFIERYDTENLGDETAQQPDDSIAPIPALDDNDPSEAIADAPVNDEAIDDPLPPLATFEVQPVEIPEGEDDSEQPVVIRYAWRIDGIEDIEREIDGIDLADLFNDLSALEDGDGKAANAAQVIARLSVDEKLAIQLLESEGYYDVGVNSNIEYPQNEGERLVAVLKIAPGERYTFSDIVIQAQPTEPPDLITKNFALASGQPIIADRVLAAEANISVILPQNGYPFVDVGDRDILLDGEKFTGLYTLPVDTGPRSRFGGFTTSGDLAFDAEHVGVLARFKRGELYDSRKTDDLRDAMVATGLFSTIALEAKPTGEIAEDGTEYVNVEVRQVAGPPRTLAAKAGYDTGRGITLEGSWTHRNLFPPEGALIANAIAGTSEQGAGLTFRRSNAGRRDRSVELGANVLRSDFAAYEAFTGQLSGRISYDSTPIWQKRFTYSLGFELVGTSEDDFNFITGQRQRDEYFIAALPVQAGFDESDSLLNPTSGFRLTARVSPEVALGRGTQTYARAMIEGSAYYPFGESIVLAGRARVATIAGIDRTDIAPSRRLYGGGGGSVRGFGYQELGPKDTNNDPIGGRSLNEVAAEVRYRFGNFGVVGFVDAGQVYTSTTPQFDNWRLGVGLGGRFYTNFGPVRLDVGTPIARKAGESLVSIYVSIGQAF